MSAELRTTAVVLSGGRLEITSPQLTEGQTVEVIVLLPESTPARGSILDLIESSRPGPHLFASPQEADRYLNQERGSW